MLQYGERFSIRVKDGWWIGVFGNRCCVYLRGLMIGKNVESILIIAVTCLSQKAREQWGSGSVWCSCFLQDVPVRWEDRTMFGTTWMCGRVRCHVKCVIVGLRIGIRNRQEYLSRSCSRGNSGRCWCLYMRCTGQVMPSLALGWCV